LWMKYRRSELWGPLGDRGPYHQAQQLGVFCL